MSHDWLDQEERMRGNETEITRIERKQALEEAVARQKRHEACLDGKHEAEEGCILVADVLRPHPSEDRMIVAKAYPCKWCGCLFVVPI